jgi:hypothetical protein
MDDHGIKIGGTQQGLLSIYHMANLFRYPLSYIFNGSEEDLVTYYHDWKNKFINIALTQQGTIIETPMAVDIYL